MYEGLESDAAGVTKPSWMNEVRPAKLGRVLIFDAQCGLQTWYSFVR